MVIERDFDFFVRSFGPDRGCAIFPDMVRLDNEIALVVCLPVYRGKCPAYHILQKGPVKKPEK
jgi:hypothetical protein